MVLPEHTRWCGEDEGSGEAARIHVLLCTGAMDELEPSRLSSAAVARALTERGYRMSWVEVGRDIAAWIERLQPTVVFNAMHGRFGEDGCFPGMLEMMGVPYTHAGVRASAVAMNKHTTRLLCETLGVRMAEGRLIHRAECWETDPMPRPYVLKPVSNGSSVGVTIVLPSSDFSMRDYGWLFGDSMLVERYIPGREAQIGLLEGRVLPSIELTTDRPFLDYTAKYEPGAALHVCPAPLPSSVIREMEAMSLVMYEALGCPSICRFDFRVDDTLPGEAGIPYLLEVNTHPGLTPSSSYPDMIRASGLSLEILVDRLISVALQSTASRSKSVMA
jgi:D-alanine-D-alanine ligase